MTRDELRQAVLRLLHQTAPEADLGALSPREDLRQQLDIDSFDFLQLLIALGAELGVEVPEADYARVSTLDRLLDYLEAHAPRASSPPHPHA